jgi:hypothetical protein
LAVKKLRIKGRLAWKQPSTRKNVMTDFGEISIVNGFLALILLLMNIRKTTVTAVMKPALEPVKLTIINNPNDDKNIVRNLVLHNPANHATKSKLRLIAARFGCIKKP